MVRVLVSGIMGGWGEWGGCGKTNNFLKFIFFDFLIMGGWMTVRKNTNNFLIFTFGDFPICNFSEGAFPKKEAS